MTWRLMGWRRTLVVALVSTGLVLAGAVPAHAAAAVSISGVDGKAQASLDGPTTLQLSGSGFQSIQGGFGGIYVMFGTVKGSWRPSMGGVSGRDYLYVPDAQAKSNAGYERFVAFPGSSTGDTANGGLVSADGTWSTTLVVPGPSFQAIDSTGQSVTVDCRTTQCGVITIGAHAVVNASNETFTPVSFGAPSDTQPTETAAPSPSAEAATASAEATPGATATPSAATPEATPEVTPEAIAAGPFKATLGVDATTAVAGHALTFTARGFQPGEQVLVVLDDGVVTAGPLTAGRYGELAGILPLDADMRVGTHVLKLTGAASEATTSAEVTVRRDPALVNAAEQAAAETATADAQGFTPLETAIMVAAALLALLVVFLLVSAATRRRRARRAQAALPPAGPKIEQWAEGSAQSNEPPAVANRSATGSKVIKDAALAGSVVGSAADPAGPVSGASSQDKAGLAAVPGEPAEALPDQPTADLATALAEPDQTRADQPTEARPDQPTEDLATALAEPGLIRVDQPAEALSDQPTEDLATALAEPDQTGADQAVDPAAQRNGILPAAEMMAQVKARLERQRARQAGEITVEPITPLSIPTDQLTEVPTGERTDLLQEQTV